MDSFPWASSSEYDPLQPPEERLSSYASRVYVNIVIRNKIPQICGTYVAKTGEHQSPL